MLLVEDQNSVLINESQATRQLFECKENNSSNLLENDCINGKRFEEGVVDQKYAVDVLEDNNNEIALQVLSQNTPDSLIFHNLSNIVYVSDPVTIDENIPIILQEAISSDNIIIQHDEYSNKVPVCLENSDLSVSFQ